MDGIKGSPMNTGVKRNKDKERCQVLIKGEMEGEEDGDGERGRDENEQREGEKCR